MNAVAIDEEAVLRRSRLLRRIGTLFFRCLEALAAPALLLSWSSSHLSFDLLRSIAAGLLGPRSIFLIANAIVLLLLADSGSFSLSQAAAAADGGGLYEEVLELRRRFSSDSLPSQEEVAFEDKAMRVETRALRRTRSEKAATVKRRRGQPELRRAETDLGPRKKGEEKAALPAAEEDDAEEFRRTIDAFIAKHTVFRREEAGNAIVVIAAPAEATCNLICSAETPEQTVLK